jgi:hypothetical protein
MRVPGVGVSALFACALALSAVSYAAAQADFPANPSIKLSPASPKSKHGKISATVTGTGWTYPGNFCPPSGENKGKLAVSIKIQKTGTEIEEGKPAKIPLKFGHDTIKGKIHVAVKPGTYTLTATLECLHPGGGWDGAGDLSQPITVR